MNKPPKPKFQKLPGRGASLASYNTLFLGEDSLIEVVATFGFHENYNRFAYSDIQALTIRKTQVGKVANTLLGIGLLVAVSVAAFNATSGGISSGIFPVSLLLAVIFLVPLLINVYAGPTCVCHIRTAIQEVRLRSLTRLRNVNKTLSFLGPLIEQAQGRLSPETLTEASRSRESPGPTGFESPTATRGDSPAAPTPAQPDEPPVSPS